MIKLKNIAQDALKHIHRKYHTRVQQCDICVNRSIHNTCKICGCFITVKAAIPTANCPEGKW